MSIVHFYFGWPDGAVWSNLVASVICAGFVWWRLRAKMIEHHVEVLAQAARHHVDEIALAEAHHVSLKKHVAQAVSSAASTAAVVVPQQLLDDIRNAPKRTPGGM